MKHIATIFLAACLLLGLGAFAQAEDNIDLTFEVLSGNPDIPLDAADRKVIPVGQLFYVTLPGNATTGYLWQCEIPEGAPLQLIAEGYVADVVVEGMAGSGGVHHFFLKITGEGEADLAFRYKRSWEEATAEDQMVYFPIYGGQ